MQAPLKDKMALVFRWILIVSFFVVLFAPGLTMLCSPRQTWSVQEKRRLADAPSLPSSLADTGRFFASLSAYFDDHFGFRKFLLRRYHREMDKRFSRTGAPNKVHKGLDGWYYMAQLKMLEDFRGETPLTTAQIERWLEIQDRKAAWLHQRGIRFLLAAAPNKQSIYPEFVMQEAEKIRGTTRFDQLRNHLHGDWPPYLVDLHQPLLAGKKNRRLYLKSDTHWNPYGAYIAFKTLFARVALLFPREPFTTVFAFDKEKTVPGGDLSIMINRKSDIRETVPSLAPYRKCARFLPIEVSLSHVSSQPDQHFIRGCPDRALTAIVFRDSFFSDLEPFFSENCKQIICLWKDYDQNNIEEILARVKPDIVFEIKAERHFFDTVTSLPGVSRTAR